MEQFALTATEFAHGVNVLGVPMTLSSSHSPCMTGAGKPTDPSAFMTRYSRSTAWADGSSLPG